VLADALPADYLFAVELNDAAAEPIGTLFEDTVHRRLLPGEGSFDVPAFINAVRATGFAGAWGVEILSDRHRSLPLPQALAEAREATRACFAEADRRRG
jgi:sugar phosphate isomerase/epimerase